MRIPASLTVLIASLSLTSLAFGADPAPDLTHDVLPLLKLRCVKCHGPAKHKARLILSTPQSIARGGEQGPLVVPGELESSLLWERVSAGEMPPDDPLNADEQELIRRWIAGGAPGLPKVSPDSGTDHWAFQRLSNVAVPAVHDGSRLQTPLDSFIQAALEEKKLTLGSEADRHTLIRRVSFDLTGLPPTPEEIDAFASDKSAAAYERMVDRYLASSHYGERWGKHWLDAAGYADSNGYFQADTDRPLAYRYRDYVIRSFNRDKPLDEFIREQLAGDELSGFAPDRAVTPQMVEQLEATHFLRNGQDGTGESDGNPDELRVDRYAVIESSMQIIGSALLGLTVQCAKCHDHKFEPISQADYYRLQAVLYPAFNVQNWVAPQKRFVFANLPGERETWEAKLADIDREIVHLKNDFGDWFAAQRPRSELLFHDDFEGEPYRVAGSWSNLAPGEQPNPGRTLVKLDSTDAPAAKRKSGTLQIREGGAEDDKWLSTRQTFHWAAEGAGQRMQVTFDLIDDKVDAKGKPAERIGYYIALHGGGADSAASGNILIDGNPAGGATVYENYPRPGSKPLGVIGSAKYAAGRNFGVRITTVGDGNYRLDHLVDCAPEGPSITLSAQNITDGAFGFEYCCGRSFTVDNVRVERLASADSDAAAADEKPFSEQLQARRTQLGHDIEAKNAQRVERPGKIAWLSDLSADAPDVYLLERGNYANPGAKVEPAPLAALAENGESLEIRSPVSGLASTGRRTAWANWLMQPGSRAVALVARVQVNRVWQQHFGRGLAATADNLGYSGSPPTHPELLDWLASQLIRSGWSLKTLHRLILNSAAYRQSSELNETAYRLDPENQLLWRFPLRRLDAESIRDAMLACRGDLNLETGGPYVPTKRNDEGEVVVDRDQGGATRRSLYLCQRRTQTLSVLGVFDAPSLVFNCVGRTSTTMPLQSLSLLNSAFAVECAEKMAARITRDARGTDERIVWAFLLAAGRKPTSDELASSRSFIEEQIRRSMEETNTTQRAWADFCQMLLASNSFLYVE